MPKNNTDLKSVILNSLSQFSCQDFISSIEQFYQTLGYSTELNVQLDNASPTDFLMMINEEIVINKRLLLDEWQSVDYLFQLTEEQIKKVTDIPEFNINYINSYLFLTITLKKDYYSRTQLSTITREINKLSAIPIMLTFRHGNSLTLAIIDRRPNQKDNDKDVLQKITLIKDINFINPHRAHLEILNDFALSKIIKENKPENFDDLHKAWRKILDTSELNKRFYKEIANWYFWAVKTVNFPSIIENKIVNNATNIIRLITRLIFVWFLKEKGLIPNTLFNINSVTNIVRSLEDEESSYYKAILQNLFFATLNTEIKPDNRQFNDSPNSYRYHDYFEDTKTYLEWTANIPFLNGGLFECLDKEMLIDGFSESVDNLLDVPNKIFFGSEESIDLSKVYGQKSRNREKVRGIINIFNDYKFTIDENTPIDEEIALDPELLGKVFENLLAEYNPETESTARKQTGSFYTPREIVNYMVDESIIAYLKQQLLNDSSGFIELGSNQVSLFGNEHRSQLTLETKVEDNPFIGKEDELETKLRELLSFSEVNPFTPDIVQKLITAIDSLKILDPACGSGAFPMGILQKLVHILSKLDPHNEQWRNQQKERAIAPLLADIKQAEKISYEEARDKAITKLKTRLQQIEDEFNNNEHDYPRKLFLIENCIYGVDIQPIAVQISKLRFFISLIVEQKVNDNLPNRGILPLPNLETKFVSANTLIGVDNQMTIRSPEVQQKEAELKKVRHDYFSANNPQEKQRCKQLDQQLRTDITTLLKSTGLTGAIADTLARWNPYDQNSSSDFFDSEWMFGVNGFDIVIGNPPYLFARDSKSKGITEADKKYFSKNYQVTEYQLNLYPLFIEKGFNLLKNKGLLDYIVPNNWLTINTNKKLRKFILNQTNIKIVNFYAKVFESADVDSSIILFEKFQQNKSIELLEYTDNFYSIYQTETKYFLKQKDYIINLESFKNTESINLLEKIELQSIQLKVIADVKAGLKAYERGKGNPLQTQEMKENRIYHSATKIDDDYIKYLDGKDVCRYCIGWSGEYLKYGDNLASPRKDFSLFSTPRILVRQIPSPLPYSINACFTQKILLNDLNSMNIINIKESPQLILGILNSKLISYWFAHKFGKLQRGIFPQFKVNELAIFPIPKNFGNNKQPIIKLVTEILEIKEKNPSADTSKLEREIDLLVYELYELTEEEIKIVEDK